MGKCQNYGVYVSRFFSRRTSSCTNSNFQSTPLGYVYNKTFKIKFCLDVVWLLSDIFGFVSMSLTEILTSHVVILN